MRVLIADDDPLSSDLLAHHVAKLDPGGTVQVSTDGRAALERLNASPFDLVLLDLRMPAMSGQELLSILGPEQKVIIVTGDRDFAVQAFERDVVDYLVKPVTFERLAQAWRKLQAAAPARTGHTPAKEVVFVREGSDIVRLDLRDVRYVKSESNYVRFHLDGRSITSLMNMKDLEQKLPASFVRVHRSYIVNLMHVEKLDSMDIKIGRDLIPVSESYRSELIERLDLL